jgi:hypothetical protein
MSVTLTLVAIAALAVGVAIGVKRGTAGYLSEYEAAEREKEPWTSLGVWQTQFVRTDNPEEKYVVTLEAVVRGTERKIIVLAPPEVTERRFLREWSAAQQLYSWRLGGTLPEPPKPKTSEKS